MENLTNNELTAITIEYTIKDLNNLNVERAKHRLIELQKNYIPDDRKDLGNFQDEIFKDVNFSDEEFRQDFVIDEIVVRNVKELSEVFRAFRILAKAYNVHCKPNKIVINYED